MIHVDPTPAREGAGKVVRSLDRMVLAVRSARAATDRGNAEMARLTATLGRIARENGLR